MLHNLFIALLIGAIAGLIDAIPMLWRGVSKHSVMAVFAQWIFIGLLIPYVDWGIPFWLQGLIIGLLGMVPTMIQLLQRGRKFRLGTRALSAALLGIGIAIASDLFIGL